MVGLHATRPEGRTVVFERGTGVVARRRPTLMLDIGCGEGRESGALARATGARVVAIDTDAAALGRAERAPRVLYVRADATRLPIASAAADAVYSYALLQVLRNGGNEMIRAAVREMRRALSGGGTAILSTLADFRSQNPGDRSLTGAEVSQVMRGSFTLGELIGLMDSDADGRVSRYWYIHALPVPEAAG